MSVFNSSSIYNVSFATAHGFTTNAITLSGRVFLRFGWYEHLFYIYPLRFKMTYQAVFSYVQKKNRTTPLPIPCSDLWLNAVGFPPPPTPISVRQDESCSDIGSFLVNMLEPPFITTSIISTVVPFWMKCIVWNDKNGSNYHGRSCCLLCAGNRRRTG